MEQKQDGFDGYFYKQQRISPSVCSPGFILTTMTEGCWVWRDRATKPPAEGTVGIKHCLFGDLEASGYYYGSDAVRSPLHFMRNPGEPPYTPLDLE